MIIIIIKGVHCVNHLAASVRNEKELFAQINDLKDDFPALFSDDLFGSSGITIIMIIVYCYYYKI